MHRRQLGHTLLREKTKGILDRPGVPFGRHPAQTQTMVTGVPAIGQGRRTRLMIPLPDPCAFIGARVF
jgi:hypothetical protein